VVEDEPSVRDLEAEFLACDGHSVETAADGDEALLKFRTGRFDVVVADRALPTMNGDQLAQAIKARSPGTPVILVTGFCNVSESNGECPPNVDLVLSKPFTYSTLRQAVGRMAPG